MLDNCVVMPHAVKHCQALRSTVESLQARQTIVHWLGAALSSFTPVEAASHVLSTRQAASSNAIQR
eukprot:9714396-Alexandrium_andersonii.AAC.1